MADAQTPDKPTTTDATTPGEASANSAVQTLGSATYEIIRQRLQLQGDALRERLSRLDARRTEVFGAIESKLLRADRIVTAHNCVPRDMVQLGHGRFLFGFNVQFGLKKEIDLADVFAVYTLDEATALWKESALEVLQDKVFITDFRRVYNVYAKAAFSKFSLIEGKLFMVFQVGAGVNDIAVFKWDYNDGEPRYLDGRSEAEFRKVGFTDRHEFLWRAPDRESYRYGDHPHVSIEDRVFVECIGGDLTIKVEDNTATGEGVYSEPVDDKYQKVDDAELGYAVIDHLVLLRIRPYKEAKPRYFIFNGKTHQAARVDSVGESCVLLPEGHGLIFPDGYYLGSGELKQFDRGEPGMIFERVIHAPNGEDSLYIFFNRESGHYALMSYRLIAQKIEERIICNGFSLFPNGHMVLFRAEAEAQKHHMIQVRQTPFHLAGHEPAGLKDAFLYQVGNKEVVRCLAECNEVLSLVCKRNPYAELYADLVKRCAAILDAYPWLSGPEGMQANESLKEVSETADKAVDEYDKVRRLQREAVQRVKDVRKRCQDQFQAVRRAGFNKLEDFVHNLAALRHLRGELITLKEIRYVDLAAIGELEKAVVEQTEQLSAVCVKFLLKPEALEPYRNRAARQLESVEKVAKAAEGKKIAKAVSEAGDELEMLIEIVNSLKIDDATETTRIIDAITSVYSTLNQVKAALKKRLQSLVASEIAAQFSAQIKLLGQSAASYLDLCDSPAKCEEYLNRISVQLEEMEGVFADYEDYTVQLTERRTELYEAFEQRKVALIEQRNRRASSLMSAAERLLKVIQNRLAGLKSVEDINAYMASDQMIAKIRETIQQLLDLGDSVKADDLQGRLKSAQQESVRQLKDRQDLFGGGLGLIKLGKHHFNVNTQPLDLTVVNRDGAQHIHLTSTKYFDEITDAEFLATRDVWEQEVVSENREVYRAEFLAHQLMKSLEAGGANLVEVLALSEQDRLAKAQEFMGARYQEGYTKGIHDLDGAHIFQALLSSHLALQLARFSPAARACGVVFWHRFCPAEVRALWNARLKSFGVRNKLFPGDATQRQYIHALQSLIAAFAQETQAYPPDWAAFAGDYLFHELTSGDAFVISQEASRLASEFAQHLVMKSCDQELDRARHSLAGHPASELELVRDWVRGFLLHRPETGQYLEEITAIVFCGAELKRAVVSASATRQLDGMRGSHPLIHGSRYTFDYLTFQERLARFVRDVVPRFEQYHRVKHHLLDAERSKLRLDVFKPRVLSSFVRNQLIDEIYLPLVGDNLAKQIGAAGDAKRTDLMGMLLLISPPGYGKTTLMEYLASRLGLIFVKINGPALGHNVTSLDPEEAPNAAAREEINKLNLALEMGDNALICLDDIQHCNPEFLQKFISLCDGQRKIEGVWRGKPRTYDLRGRKVVVVMAGNPYTESGTKFKIPDMLANRADTYNLGDIIGGSAAYFKASYLENAITSNAVLAPLANKSQKDIRSFIRMAESGEREAEGFESSYSRQEVEEILSVMRKLAAIREIILKVNLEYIHSAAQADEFRTEPPFKLQGSYRNMNRLAEKVVTIMNDAEVMSLVVDHYRGESQTLTSGAEANLLKFKVMIGAHTEAEMARWEEIKKTFKRNQLVRGGDQNDPVGRVVAQLAAFQSGLESIQETLARQLSTPNQQPPVVIDLTPVTQGLSAIQSALENQLSKGRDPVVVDFSGLNQNLEALRKVVEKRLESASQGAVAAPAPVAEAPSDSAVVAREMATSVQAMGESLVRVLGEMQSSLLAKRLESLNNDVVAMYNTLETLKDLAREQSINLRAAQDTLTARAKQGTMEIEVTQDMLTNERLFLEKVHQMLSERQQPPTVNPPPSTDAIRKPKSG